MARRGLGDEIVDGAATGCMALIIAMVGLLVVSAQERKRRREAEEAARVYCLPDDLIHI